MRRHDERSDELQRLRRCLPERLRVHVGRMHVHHAMQRRVRGLEQRRQQLRRVRARVHSWRLLQWSRVLPTSVPRGFGQLQRRLRELADRPDALRLVCDCMQRRDAVLRRRDVHGELPPAVRE